MGHYLHENDNIVVQFPGKLSVNLLYSWRRTKQIQVPRNTLLYLTTLLPYYWSGGSVSLDFIFYSKIFEVRQTEDFKM